MKNKKGVVLSLLMSLLVSGSSAVESGKGNNSKGGGTVTLEKRNNIEKGKTIAGYAVPIILAFILGYKFGHRNEDVNNKKEIQEGKQLNKCPLYNCDRKGKEFGLSEKIYICKNCFSIYCRDCSYKDCQCGLRNFWEIEEFIKRFNYLPALRNVAKLAKYRFVMKAQEEQKKKDEEQIKNKNKLDEIVNI